MLRLSWQVTLGNDSVGSIGKILYGVQFRKAAGNRHPAPGFPASPALPNAHISGKLFTE